MSRRAPLAALAAALLLGAALLLAAPSVAWRALSAETLQAALASLRSFGPWTPLASLALMVAQSVISPLPGSLIAAANGALFGVWWGTLLSWLGGMAGACTTYALGRWLAGPVTARWGGSPAWRRLERLAARDGFWVVLVARLTPLISLDVVGYLAGVSRVPFPAYLLANAIGIAPGMLAYTLLGHDLLLAGESAWRAALAGLALAGLFLLGRWWLRRRDALPDG